jgi:hypothetical protein
MEKAQDKHARVSRPTEYRSVNQQFASARSDRVAFNGDLAYVLAEVLQALVSAEHQALVETWSAAMRQQL